MAGRSNCESPGLGRESNFTTLNKAVESLTFCGFREKYHGVENERLVSWNEWANSSKEAAKNVHRRDPHELASWVKKIYRLIGHRFPAASRPPLPDFAAGGGGIGEWGTGGGRETVTD